MGHDHVLTTLTCYGQVPLDRQAEIIGGLGNVPTSAAASDAMASKIDEIHAILKNRGL